VRSASFKLSSTVIFGAFLLASPARLLGAEMSTRVEPPNDNNRKEEGPAQTAVLAADCFWGARVFSSTYAALIASVFNADRNNHRRICEYAAFQVARNVAWSKLDGMSLRGAGSCCANLHRAPLVIPNARADTPSRCRRCGRARGWRLGGHHLLPTLS
jgi:hypothetical protein